MSHLFSVRNQTLHVPLAIEGLEGRGPGVVETPVGLVNVAGALRCWALDEGCDSSWPLPGASEETQASPADSPLFSFYSDAAAMLPPQIFDKYEVPEGYELTNPHRNNCLPKDRVFGEMASMIRYPMKINWVEDQPIELYDLSWDPGERSNLAEVQTEAAADLAAELETYLKERIRGREHGSGEGLSEEQIRALKSLGYIE